jgi:5-methylcytosine-specific restriction endonuclease McrA
MIDDLLRFLLPRIRPEVSRSIPAVTRRLVLARDGRVCRYCGKVANGDLEYHHVLPYRYFTPAVVNELGSPHQHWNVVVTCRDCNRRIGDNLGYWPGARPQRGIIELILRLVLEELTR